MMMYCQWQSFDLVKTQLQPFDNYANLSTTRATTFQSSNIHSASLSLWKVGSSFDPCQTEHMVACHCRDGDVCYLLVEGETVRRVYVCFVFCQGNS